MFFGNWISSERVRYAGGNAEVLVDVNAHLAATALKFTIARWDYQGASNPQYSAYGTWVKGHIAAGHPVVIGLYQSVLDGDPGGGVDVVVPLFTAHPSTCHPTPRCLTHA
jgi:hypothetical protein